MDANWINIILYKKGNLYVRDFVMTITSECLRISESCLTQFFELNCSKESIRRNESDVLKQNV